MTNSVDLISTANDWMVFDLDDPPIDPMLRDDPVQYLDTFDFAMTNGGALEDSPSVMAIQDYGHTSLDLSSDAPAVALTLHEAEPLVVTDQHNDQTRLPTSMFLQMRQETVQAMSDLNMQMSRAILPTTKEHLVSRSSLPSTALATPPGEDDSLSEAAVFMMHSLQTYHRLLAELLGSAELGDFVMHEPCVTPPHSTTVTRLLSPVERERSEAPIIGRTSGAAVEARSKRARADSGADFTTLHRTSHVANLDLPTSLLLLSGHTNLIRLCRETFGAIRASLLVTRHQLTLFKISFLKIDDLPMPVDRELQIMILIQTVLRMFDRIERLLRCSEVCNVEAGGERRDVYTRGCVLPHRLLDLVLRSDPCGEGPADRVGTQALREELRQLHELVYRPM
jgi:hypothetical protein